MDYVDRTIVEDIELYNFDTNTYGEDRDFTIDSCVSHTDTLQSHKNSPLPYKLVQISERGVQPKDLDHY